jgi:hypothetical protein
MTPVPRDRMGFVTMSRFNFLNFRIGPKLAISAAQRHHRGGARR